MKSNKMYTCPNRIILLKLTGSIKKNLILIQYLINVCNKHERKIPCPYYVVCSFLLRYACHPRYNNYKKLMGDDDKIKGTLQLYLKKAPLYVSLNPH